MLRGQKSIVARLWRHFSVFLCSSMYTCKSSLSSPSFSSAHSLTVQKLSSQQQVKKSYKMGKMLLKIGKIICRHNRNISLNKIFKLYAVNPSCLCLTTALVLRSAVTLVAVFFLALEPHACRIHPSTWNTNFNYPHSILHFVCQQRETKYSPSETDVEDELVSPVTLL